MKTLEQHNKDRRFPRPSYPMPSGIACPNCGAELSYKTPEILASIPPKRLVVCFACGHHDYANA